MTSKISKVRRWLEAGRSITPRLAQSRFKYWRLSDGIMKLKRLGLKIETELVRRGDCTRKIFVATFQQRLLKIA